MVTGTYYASVNYEGSVQWHHTIGQVIYSPLFLAFTQEVEDSWRLMDPTYFFTNNVAIIMLQKLEDGSEFFRLVHLYEVQEEAEARDIFETFLHQLSLRLSHILKMLLPTTLYSFQKDEESLGGYDRFIIHVTTAFYSIVEADVVLHFGTHGSLKFMPGKQVGMSGFCYPDNLMGKHFPCTYANYFSNALIAKSDKDDGIIVIYASVGEDTSLDMYTKRFFDRCFDVGMAEQHTVTFAAGLACEGLKPFCVINSSFLQRAYDQVIHDVDLQKLLVRFAMDGAGLGADGPTLLGAFSTLR